VASGPKNNPLAIASLVTALAGIPLMCLYIGWLAWIVALVLGLIALSQIKKSGDAQTGRGMALGGVITSGVLLALSVIGGIILVIAIATADVDSCNDFDNDPTNDCDDFDDFDDDF